ncbi:hypothetical protein B566_EDAN013262 [Ephemera danica]|nr:hypothetical protein B566_EDAN013262 [Ephemera danica]
MDGKKLLPLLQIIVHSGKKIKPKISEMTASKEGICVRMISLTSGTPAATPVWCSSGRGEGRGVQQRAASNSVQRPCDCPDHATTKLAISVCLGGGRKKGPLRV